MLKAHEIFARLSPVVAAELLAFIESKEKPLYRATIETIAKQRKLRPVFIERKLRPERSAWLQTHLGRAQHDAVAAHLLQIWLVGAQTSLLCDFLDALGIPHDQNGTIETLPAAPPKTELAAAVEKVLEKHDPGVVAAYLHAFQAMDENGWP